MAGAPKTGTFLSLSACWFPVWCKIFFKIPPRVGCAKNLLPTVCWRNPIYPPAAAKFRRRESVVEENCVVLGIFHDDTKKKMIQAEKRRRKKEKERRKKKKLRVQRTRLAQPRRLLYTERRRSPPRSERGLEVGVGWSGAGETSRYDILRWNEEEKSGAFTEQPSVRVVRGSSTGAVRGINLSQCGGQIVVVPVWNR